MNTICDTVVEAVRLSNEIASLQAKLDACKNEIRSYANNINIENKSLNEKVLIETIIGECKITFSKDRKSFRKGSSPEVLAGILPNVVFNKLFETKLCFTDKFDSVLDALDDNSKTAVVDYVEYTPTAPAVCLPKV